MIFRSVTFDLDGTLLDTVADLAEACRRMAEELGVPPRSLEEVRAFVGKGMAVLVERCLTDPAPLSPALLQAGIATFERHYEAVNGVQSALYPGVTAGLEQFRRAGLALAVVTNKPARFTQPLLERTGLRDFFRAVVSGDTTPHKKPHPEPILHACRLLGNAVAANLHIGDSINDALAARAAGCRAFCVPYGYNEGRPVDRADWDALVSDLPAAYRQAQSFDPLAGPLAFSTP